MRDYILDDIMALLSNNEDVQRRYYVAATKPRRLMTREDFDKFPDNELVEAYKEVVIRCFRQR
jgi:hypothetical protein